MRRWIIPFGIVALVCLFLVAGLARHAGSGRVAGHPVVGASAPDFGETGIDGRFVSISDERGKPVLINFFATWCVPCRAEMRDIDRVYRGEHGSLAVLAVDKEEPADQVRAFARDLHLHFTPLLDPNGSVFDLYGVRVQPVSFWIGPDGRIAAIHYGPMTPGYMRREAARMRSG